MNFVRIDPPGTFCTLEALRDALKRCGGKTFLDVGCGTGAMSKVLLEAGLTGTGVDFSKSALDLAAINLRHYLEDRKYNLHFGDVLELPETFKKVDVVISYMVMEHVEDHEQFLLKLKTFLAPGGHLIVAVPGRMDRWSIEDETVGHFRRYERDQLTAMFDAAGLQNTTVWSVSVPVSNLLFNIGTALLKRSSETAKVNLSKTEQTKASGIQDIPWKTTFPSFVRLLLNRKVLYPLFVVQRWFYSSNYGLTLMAIGKN